MRALGLSVLLLTGESGPVGVRLFGVTVSEVEATQACQLFAWAVAEAIYLKAAASPEQVLPGPAMVQVQLCADVLE